MNNFKNYTRKVYYYETDKMGIMHHSNYIRIFEEARMFFLTERGLPFEKIESFGLKMPVLSVECQYKTPLMFDNEFEVQLSIIKFNGVRMFITYKVINTATGALCAIGTSSHCFTDTNLKPIRTKNNYPDIYSFFNDYVQEN